MSNKSKHKKAVKQQILVVNGKPLDDEYNNNSSSNVYTYSNGDPKEYPKHMYVVCGDEPYIDDDEDDEWVGS